MGAPSISGWPGSECGPSAKDRVVEAATRVFVGLRRLLPDRGPGHMIAAEMNRRHQRPHDERVDHVGGHRRSPEPATTITSSLPVSATPSTRRHLAQTAIAETGGEPCGLLPWRSCGRCAVRGAVPEMRPVGPVGA